MANQKLDTYTSNLVKEFYITVSEVGPKETMRILKKGRQTPTYKSDLKLLARAVCKSFEEVDMNEETLFGNYRKYPRKQAFSIWCYIAFTDKNFKFEELVSYAESSDSIISQSKKTILDLINKSEKELTSIEKLTLKKLEKTRSYFNELQLSKIE